MALLDGDASAPHFDLPFRLTPSGAVLVEQDTYEDVANCVEAIVRTPQGWRDEMPDFGIPSYEFDEQPILKHSELQNIIHAQESRATVDVSEMVDPGDNLIDHISVSVRQ